jgi:hypothetical protein
VNPGVARTFAVTAHAGQRTVDGESLIAHLTRVADSVPREARATAWLHELGERGAASVHDLLATGITPVELAALELLTLADGEDYGLYLRRIAGTKGPAGALARTVKNAELADHIEHLPPSSSAARWYRRAREQLERRRRRTERRTAHQRAEAA